jgi:hypothetical protein
MINCAQITWDKRRISQSMLGLVREAIVPYEETVT